MFDWSNLVRHYDDAHKLALERIGDPRPGKVEVRMVLIQRCAGVENSKGDREDAKARRKIAKKRIGHR